VPPPKGGNGTVARTGLGQRRGEWKPIG